MQRKERKRNEALDMKSKTAEHAKEVLTEEMDEQIKEANYVEGQTKLNSVQK